MIHPTRSPRSTHPRGPIAAKPTGPLRPCLPDCPILPPPFAILPGRRAAPAGRHGQPAISATHQRFATGFRQGVEVATLSAQSGLPAISLPAGFGADGLPIGLELLGRAFADTQLVAYAYALERARPLRRAPHTTPALVAGRAPMARPVTVTLAHPGVTARVTVTVDPVRHEFRWAAQLTGPRAGAVHALVLRRRGGGQPLTGVISGASATGTVTTRVEVPANAVRVDSRLLGPGMTAGRGTLPLGGVLRAAWEAEALSVALVGEDGALAERALPRR